MKIQCQNCGVEHEIDPPSWVVSSGRAFRFRCSSCGYSQSVQPPADEPQERAPSAPPPVTTPQPSFPPADVRPAPTPTSAPTAPQRTGPAASEGRTDEPAARVTGPTITPYEETANPVAHLGPAPEDPPERGSAVFLKQNGQIYMVSDWETLKRWIAESRVDRHDLVSEGGVRWEPIGSRPDLLPAFSGTDITTAPNLEQAAHFPFGGETPFGGDYQTASGWHDDDTEGIPTGLPPLPTEESPLGGSPTGFDAVDLRPRHMTPTPPPVARRQPPPVMRPSFVPPPPPEPEIHARPEPDPPVMEMPDPEPVPEPAVPERPEPSIAPPALPDTVPPPPIRASPSGPRVVTKLDEATPTMETEVLSRPTGPASEPEVESDFYEPDTDEVLSAARTSGRPLMMLGCALLLVLTAFVVAVGFTVYPAFLPKPQPDLTLPLKPVPQVDPAPVTPDPVVPKPVTPDPVAPDPIQVEPTPDPIQVEPAPDPIQVEPAPDPVAPTPVPQPGPQPQPGPVAPAPTDRLPSGSTVSGLVSRGWNLADSNPSAAKGLFLDALDASPDNVDAHYGYGYTLLKSGDRTGARPHLCIAASRGNTDTRREVHGMLENAGMSCP
ncbi:MAG: hypothetical protein R3F61_38965 [Myxococcota bacterium]